MAEAVGSPPPVWETWNEFPSPRHLGNDPADGRFLCFFFSLSNKIYFKHVKGHVEGQEFSLVGRDSHPVSPEDLGSTPGSTPDSNLGSS